MNKDLQQKVRNPGHDMLGVKCICKKCRTYRDWLEKQNEQHTTKTPKGDVGR